MVAKRVYQPAKLFAVTRRVRVKTFFMPSRRQRAVRRHSLLLLCVRVNVTRALAPPIPSKPEPGGNGAGGAARGEIK